MPWVKGQSGNPNGRPKTQVQFVERLKKNHTEEAENGLLVATKSGESWAIQLVLAYAWGKPSERPPTLENFSDEQLEAEIERRLVERHLGPRQEADGATPNLSGH